MTGFGRLSILAAGLALLGSQAVAGATALNREIVYTCERGVSLPVVFVNRADPAIAVALIEGQLVMMRRVEIAPDLFYADTDEQRGYRLRGSVNEIQLRWLAPDHTAEEQVLLADCSAG